MLFPAPVNFRFRGRLILSIFFFLLLSPAARAAAEADLQSTVTLAEDRVNLKVVLLHKNTSQLKEALLRGVVYHLKLEWKVENIAPRWYKLNSTPKKGGEEIVLKYDRANKAYYVTIGQKTHPFFSFTEAWQKAADCQASFPVKDLPAGNYIAHVRAKGESLKLYFPLDVIYRNFVTETDFSLDWREIYFSVQK